MVHNILNILSIGNSNLTVNDIVECADENRLKNVFAVEDSGLSFAPYIISKAKSIGKKSIFGSMIHVEGLGSLVLYPKNNAGFSELSIFLSELESFKMGKIREFSLDAALNFLSSTNNIAVVDGFQGSFLSVCEDVNKYKKLLSAAKGNYFYALSPIDAKSKERIFKLSDRLNIPIIISSLSQYKDVDDAYNWLANYAKAGYFRGVSDKKDPSLDEVVKTLPFSFFRGANALNNTINPNRFQHKHIITSDDFVNKFEQVSLEREIDFPKMYKKVKRNNTLENPLRSVIRKIWLKNKPNFNPSDVSKYEKRIAEEINTIESLDPVFEQYFLFFYSLARRGRAEGFEASVRGSAGGSLVLYLLGLSKADPIKNGLSFERFIFKGIEGFPDIDMDVSDKDGLINLLKENYGQFFAEIETISTVNKVTKTTDMAMSALQLSGDYSNAHIDAVKSKINRLSKFVRKSGDESTASFLVRENKFWKSEYDKDPLFKKVLDTAIKFEGLPQNKSNSVSSSVLSSFDLKTIMPVQSGVISISSDKCEELGLLKIDILSSPILKKIKEIKSSIEWDKDVSITNYVSDDNNIKEVYQYISSGLTEGVNQIGKPIGKFICGQVKPEKFSDLVVIMGLIRMGINENSKDLPIDYVKFLEGKNNKSSIKYVHSDLKPILEETYGAIIYEEQIMDITRVFGGFSHNEANQFRKCITKTKDKDKLSKFRELFFERGLSNGYDFKELKEIFTSIEGKMSQFNFSKNHASNYAMISLEEMYLKINYPSEFLSVTSSFNAASKKLVPEIGEEYAKMGYMIKRPHINDISKGVITEDFSYQGSLKKIINLSLEGVLNSGFKDCVCLDIEKNGNFESLSDFAVRLAPYVSSYGALSMTDKEKIEFKGELLKLVSIGAFDALYEQKIKELNVDSDIFDNKLDLVLYIRGNLERHIDHIVDNISLDSDFEYEFLDIEKLRENGFSLVKYKSNEHSSLGVSPIGGLEIRVNDAHKKKVGRSDEGMSCS